MTYSQISRNTILAALVALGVLSAPALAQDQGVNPLELALNRSHAPNYQAGTFFTVTISIQASVAVEPGQLTALGLRESIPPGWTFLGAQAVSGGTPGVMPNPGQEGLLEFAWIQPPEFPYTFEYALQVPPDAAGSQVIHGQFEYRLDGGPQFVPPVVTTLNGADTTPPTITINGSNPESVQQGDGWNDQGATANDNVDGDITSQIVTSGNVNTNSPGTYTITYTVSDAAGNNASATRTVVVVEVTQPSTDGGVTQPRTNRNTSNANSARPRASANNSGRNSSRRNNSARNNANDVAAEISAMADANARRNPNSSAPSAVSRVPSNTAARAGAASVVIPKRIDDPSGSTIPGQPAGQGTTPTPASQQQSRSAHPQARGKSESGTQLYDEWPEGEAPAREQLARVAEPNLILDADSDSAGGALAESPGGPGFRALLITAAACVLVAALLAAVFFFGNRTAYGGRARKR